MKVLDVINFGRLQKPTTGGVIPPAPSFGIYKGSLKKPYGEYHWGEFKDKKIEIFDAYKFGQKLIYVSDKFKNFVKSKLTYVLDGIKRVTTAEGKR